ncbi:hypothetical protein [Pseudomonas sp. dw_358]|uniref:structural cement protein Gp24 n=1 Tax=Pseudomonas sp. dw_358 TaxID=2720083 RepID=UPI001BD39D6C|nr:hypothetical protein [Pseudomonas sp. dw_358]
MAIAQDQFDIYRLDAYEGQIGTIEVNKVDSGVAGADIPFGRAVVRDPVTGNILPWATSSAAWDLLGISVRSQTGNSVQLPQYGSVYPITTAGYLAGQNISYMTNGAIRAMCVDGALAGNIVSIVNTAGANLGRLSTGDGVQIPFLRWKDDVTAGSIGWIELNGIFTASGV